MTVEQVLKEFSSLIEDGEINLIELEVLLAFALGEEKEFLISHRDDEVDDALLELFMGYVERARQGEPIAYILKEKEFFGLNFYVDQRVLVPRPETELLVEKSIDYLIEKNGKATVLDLGTGSGNIIVSLIKTLSLDYPDLNVKGEGTEVSEEALEVAKMNAEQHAVEDRIQFYISDLLEGIEQGAKYEIILANLPYIGKEKNHFIEKNVEDNEPHVALFGGDDGLVLYRKLFQQLQDKDIDFKYMIGEFGFSQAESMGKALEEFFPGRWKIVKDHSGIDRVFEVQN